MLTICEAGDLAAVKAIERRGGVLEDVRTPGQVSAHLAPRRSIKGLTESFI